MTKPRVTEIVIDRLPNADILTIERETKELLPMHVRMRRLVAVLWLAGLIQGQLVGDENVPPPSINVATAPLDSQQAIAALKPLLLLASQNDKTTPDQIASRIKSLALPLRNDPRLYYIHGLSLLKNMRHGEAIEALKLGASQPVYYFPIQRVLISEQIREKQYPAAIESLMELAARIGDSAQLWTSEDDRLLAGRWLGRSIAFLSGPSGNPEAMELASLAQSVIQMQLPPVYQTEMEGGINELHAEHRALQIQLLAAADVNAEKKKQQLKEAEQKQSVIEAQKKELSTSAREQQAVQKEQLKEIDSQLAALEKQFVQLQASEEKISKAIDGVRVDIARIPFLAQIQPVTPGSILGLNSSPQMNGARANESIRQQSILAATALKEAELQAYLVDLQKNRDKQQAVLVQAEMILTARGQSLAASQSADKKNQQLAEGLGRWEKRISYAKKKSLTDPDSRSSAVKNRISLFSTYEPFRVGHEIEQLTLFFISAP